MMIVLALIALLFCLFASYISQAKTAIAEVVMPVSAVEICFGEKNAACRRMAVSTSAIGTVNSQQTAVPPE